MTSEWGRNTDTEHSFESIKTGRLVDALSPGAGMLCSHLLVQGVQSCLGLGDQGLSSSKVALAAGLLDGDFISNDLALLSLNLSSIVLNPDPLLLNSNLWQKRK